MRSLSVFFVLLPLCSLTLENNKTDIDLTIDNECLDIDELPGNASLTEQEIDRLQQETCITQDGLDYYLQGAPQNGIPQGVDCEPLNWCDYYNRCTTVCKPGSVVLSGWFNFAMRTQIELSNTQSLCYQTLLGTHNSAISLAYGYGNEE
eukprot:TRINITY_DN16379_c0_g1_i2.p1 TRINITY_DN16379_c0_g1~~TRINITY_DN16379_c0_g1_i2.p1  ORF type:complete len:149 (+),score=13.10 TRINITY_DN16379_c0_g1_i2:74-520(+)